MGYNFSRKSKKKGLCAPYNLNQVCTTDRDCGRCGLACLDSFAPFGNKRCSFAKGTLDAQCSGNTICINGTCKPETCKINEDCKRTAASSTTDQDVVCLQDRCAKRSPGKRREIDSLLEGFMPPPANKTVIVKNKIYNSTARLAYRDILMGEDEIYISKDQGLKEITFSEMLTSVYVRKWIDSTGVAKYCRKFPKKKDTYTNCMLFWTEGLYGVTSNWVVDGFRQPPRTC